MLTVENLKVAYGRVEAVRGVSFAVPAGQIAALIGANGAGKSSTLNALTGLVRCRGKIAEGDIRFDGLATDAIVRHGVVQVAQGRQLFPLMSVRENLELGAFLRSAADKRRRLDELMARFPLLAERAEQAAGTLSGGEQQLVAIARALMAEPRILLIDEPCLGLAPIMIRRVAAVLRDLHAAGLTILIAEQNASFATAIAEHLLVMENGRITQAGPPAAVMAHADVRRAYLGI
ncbi:ABC transporter ATP-binding protein [Chelatococcus reniformis]|uniref:ABC transporter ATP-binding protein n=1 Tax=Chelatococcus reniformis TaxID=1494448 RepID=A0A916X6Z2_9HYPH|nr:ABC transporter ATP-binding protein [Chelatococcus reniformis]GGC47842.1 ABC transporter ATP-binding protein [Chelatococcus reniformis]